MCLKKWCENMLEGCNAHNCDLVEPLEGSLSWKRIYVKVNALNLSCKWRNCMVMNQVNEVIIIACCYEYTCDKNKELHV
jgi:hypothetical protein